MNRKTDKWTDRQPNRKTDRWTDRHTDRQTDRWTERQTDEQTDIQTDRQTDEQKDRQTDRQMNRKTDRWTDRHTDRQTDEQKDRQTDRQINRQTVHVRAVLFVQLKESTHRLPLTSWLVEFCLCCLEPAKLANKRDLQSGQLGETYKVASWDWSIQTQVGC